MKMDEIIKNIKLLSLSQGFYGRLLNSILNMKQTDKRRYNRLVKLLEGQNFKDPVDMVMYFEQ